MPSTHRTRIVLALGTAQTLAWASSYYLPAILAAPIARDLGVSTATVFAAFSIGLVISAFLGPRAGRAIDAFGGRPVLGLSNLTFAIGLAGLGTCTGPWGLFAAWIVIGIAMSGGLYEAAFASLVKFYGSDSRNVITGITLIAGFASTVGWPFSIAVESWQGWRAACFAWAGLHRLVGLPLNLSLPHTAIRLQTGLAGSVLPVSEGSNNRFCERFGLRYNSRIAAGFLSSHPYRRVHKLRRSH